MFRQWVGMAFKILCVAATSSEADITGRIPHIEVISGGFRLGNTEIIILVTGVGSISTAWSMQKWISVNEKPDLAVNLGIAGSYSEEFIVGDVVMPVSDCFADAGIEDGKEFLTLSEAGLSNANEFPFRDGMIHGDPGYTEKLASILKPVRAVTVNTATGSDATKERIIKKYNPDIETMEGATFFYICSREKIPFLALRAISNMVEHRNKAAWNIPLALKNLSEKLNEVMLTL